MEITTIITSTIASIGYVIGRIIRGTSKEEIKPGKKITKLFQDISFGGVLAFLFITFDLNIPLSILLGLGYASYSFFRNKKHKTINIILSAAALASTFRTQYFTYTAATIFLYTLVTGIKTKRWKDVIKKTTILLILILGLIYLRTI